MLPIVFFSHKKVLLRKKMKLIVHIKRELPYLGIFVVVTAIYGHKLSTLDVFAVQAQARLSVTQSAFRGVFPHLLVVTISTALYNSWLSR